MTLVGIDKAKICVEEKSMEAILLLHSLKGENPFLEELLKALIHREK